MARPCSRALLLALALAGAHSALAQTAAEAVAPVAAIAAPAVDSAALAIATDANPTVYAAVTAEAPPVLPAAPVVAEAPQAGVSAWVVPSDTQAAAGGMWNTQRLLEAAVGLSFLVLVFFFIINRSDATIPPLRSVLVPTAAEPRSDTPPGPPRLQHEASIRELGGGEVWGGGPEGAGRRARGVRRSGCERRAFRRERTCVRIASFAPVRSTSCSERRRLS